MILAANDESLSKNMFQGDIIVLYKKIAFFFRFYREKNPSFDVRSKHNGGLSNSPSRTVNEHSFTLAQTAQIKQ